MIIASIFPLNMQLGIPPSHLDLLHILIYLDNLTVYLRLFRNCYILFTYTFDHHTTMFVFISLYQEM